MKFFLFSLAFVGFVSVDAATLYSIGNPTPEEQWYVELINRARADPPAEGERLRTTTDPDVLAAYQYFGVDTSMLALQFQLLSPAPPLSINSQLMQSARLHSQDMADHEFQGHNGTDGSSPGSRVSGQGYSWVAVAENVFAYSQSVFYGHASFEVDWGTGLGGMQTPPGHRINIHNRIYREIGVGVVFSAKQTVGPQLVTQDFASDGAVKPFITGVVWADQNGNNSYEAGEGIGGITVSVAGSSYYAVSASAGGYSVPVPGSGAYTVTFSGPGSAVHQARVVVTATDNAKLDYLVLPVAGAIIRITSLRPNSLLTELDFQIDSGNPSQFTIESAGTVAGPWSEIPTAVITPGGAGVYHASWVAIPSSSTFYRVRAVD